MKNFVTWILKSAVEMLTMTTTTIIMIIDVIIIIIIIIIIVIITHFNFPNVTVLYVPIQNITRTKGGKEGLVYINIKSFLIDPIDF